MFIYIGYYIIFNEVLYLIIVGFLQCPSFLNCIEVILTLSGLPSENGVPSMR